MKKLISFLLVGFVSLQSIAHNKLGVAMEYEYENYYNHRNDEIPNIKYQIQHNNLSDSLNKYVGGYLLSGQTIKVYLKENKLMALIPDQPEYELEFVKEYEFQVKGAPGFTVRFETDKKGNITGFTLVQPDGKVKAKKVSGEVNNIPAIPVQFTKEQLEKYAGDYLLSGNTLKIYLSENMLMAKISSQPDYELVPVSESNFNVKGVSGFSVLFKKDNKGNVTECIISQPGGNVTAKRISK